jgi:enoyl-CoA hydratase/carnithine racemase
MARMMSDPVPPGFTTLRVEVAGGLGLVELARPERLNALSPTLLDELADASRWLATLPDLRVVRLRGAGRAFCAGYDLDAMRSSRATLDRAATDRGRRMAEAVSAIPAITIAAVHGHCVGGGVVLAACCDLRIAADDTRFSIPELALGIPLGWGGVPRLVALVGPTVAMELVVDCTPFDARQARDWRFVNRVVPATALKAESLAWAQRLAQRPLNALRATKRRFAEVVERLSPAAGSEADADALLAAYADAETQDVQRRYMQQRGRG